MSEFIFEGNAFWDPEGEEWKALPEVSVTGNMNSAIGWHHPELSRMRLHRPLTMWVRLRAYFGIYESLQ